MGPIEGVWFTLIGVFILLGMIRGFLKELGLTTVMIVWLFGMDQIIPRVEELITQDDSPLASVGITSESMDGTLWLVFTLITVLVVYVAYQGETLAFEGTPPRGPSGLMLGGLIGAINGYLVTGTLWFLLNRYHYPIRDTGLFFDFAPGQTLSPLAEQIVNQLRLLPPDLLGQGVESASSLGVLPLLVVTMILLRVLR